MSLQKQAVREEETPTETQSQTLIRNLIRTAISSIAYLRNLFPEDCFKECHVAGMNLKSLTARTDESRLLISWLQDGVFDALDKKYLRTIIFGISSTDPSQDSSLIESYNFNVTYSDEEMEIAHLRNGKPEETVKTVTRGEIKKTTVILLRQLSLLTQTLVPLPDTRFLTIKLLYNDDITPPDYEPKFFRAAVPEEVVGFEKKPVKVKIGSVETPFHQLCLKLKTTVDLFEDFAEGDDKHEDLLPVNQPNKSAASKERKQVAEMAEDVETEPSESLVQEEGPTIVVSSVFQNQLQAQTPGRCEGSLGVDDANQQEMIRLYISALEVLLHTGTVSVTLLKKELRSSNDVIARTLLNWMERDGAVFSPHNKKKGSKKMTNSATVKNLIEIQKLRLRTGSPGQGGGEMTKIREEDICSRLEQTSISANLEKSSASNLSRRRIFPPTTPEKEALQEVVPEVRPSKEVIPDEDSKRKEFTKKRIAGCEISDSQDSQLLEATKLPKCSTTEKPIAQIKRRRR